jgi:hypothetical protein
VDAQEIGELVYVGLHTPNIKILAVDKAERYGHGDKQHDLLDDDVFMRVHAPQNTNMPTKKTTL